MKRALFAFMLTITALVAAWSQPKVAVLDAIIPQNMDPSVIVPATEKIIEKLVQSNRFTVLDRANIEGVLKEREFQVSGMVSDQDVVTAGKYLGADFVVVAKVSKVGDTNFISGKMINVKTGVIASQTSAQGEGKLSALIGLAGQVGEVLAGGVATQPPAENKEVVVTPPPDQTIPESPAQSDGTPSSYSKPPFTDSFVGVGLFYNAATWKASLDEADAEIKDKLNFGTIQFQIIAVKYIQLGIGYQWFTSGTWEENVSGTTLDSGDLYSGYSWTSMVIDFMFRIPIRFGGSQVALVPMAGFEYDINLSYKDDAGNDIKKTMTQEEKANLNRFFLQLGAGLQINAGNVVIYPELIYGFKIKSQLDSDNETALTSYYGTPVTISSGKLDLGVIIGFKI
jgi:hypothetical protein